MRVIAFAYACEPGKGSEPGAGWTWARMIARSADTWVITRANNRLAIEAALPELPERSRLRFVYVDLPRGATFWKKGQRGVRLYYGLWQIAALVRARRLHREVGFDVAWHLTLANAWLGSTAGLIGCPLVYGPVGGGVDVPWRLGRLLGVRGVLYEIVRAAARIGSRYANPLARLGWWRARIVLAQNPETRDWLPRRHRSKTLLLQNAVALEAPARRADEERGGAPTALFAGRLIPWKGGALAIRALVHAPEWRLVVCGAGPDEKRLRTLATRLGVEQRVEFHGKVSHAEIAAQLDRCHALLHPSLHDDSPLAVTEALAHGVPVVCLDRGGPPLLASNAELVASASGSVDEVAQAVAACLRLARAQQHAVRAKTRAAELSFAARAEVVRRLLGTAAQMQPTVSPSPALEELGA